LESSQSHLETLQSQNTELQYQLRETSERLANLNEELIEARREQDLASRGQSASTEDVAHLLSAAEAKYESKIAELRGDLAVVEKERTEAEAVWSRKLREKARDSDELKRLLESTAKAQDQRDEVVSGLRDEITQLREEVKLHQRHVTDLQAEAEDAREAQVGLFILKA
jgi:predicted RNase H-like nuclease (RuvC/YqgF family)